jgi:AhpC/TSA family
MIPDLKQRIEEFQKSILPKVPPDLLKQLNEGVDDMLRAEVDRAALRVGARAPDFELPNAAGEAVRLSQLLARGPAVVTFYRGGW